MIKEDVLDSLIGTNLPNWLHNWIHQRLSQYRNSEKHIGNVFSTEILRIFFVHESQVSSSTVSKLFTNNVCRTAMLIVNFQADLVIVNKIIAMIFRETEKGYEGILCIATDPCYISYVSDR